MDNHFDFSREGVEGGRADDGIGVTFVDCHIWLGAEGPSGIYVHGVEDGDFVGAKYLRFPVSHA